MKQTKSPLFNFIVCVTAAMTGSVSLAQDAATSSQQLLPLLADLDSSQYATRIQASRTLKSLSSNQLSDIARLANDTSSAETVIRIVAELDNRYSSPSKLRTESGPDVASPNKSGSLDNMMAASVALESLVTEQRVLIAEAAEQSLSEHADKRTAIALQELQALGAFIRFGAMPTSNIGMGPQDSSQLLQILLTKEWKGGEEGLEIFTRLEELFGPLRNFRNPRMATELRASVYLIDGHQVSEQAESRLAELTGQPQVQHRSEVALGIVWDSMFSFVSGVVIGNISKGGSAQQAGLNPGDLLLAIETDKKPEQPDPRDLLFGQQRPLPGDDTLGENRIPLRDFDDLVTRLKDYRKGDVIKLRVVRNGKDLILNARGIRFGNRRPEPEPLEPKPEVVDVKLTGWEELGREWKFPY